MTVVEVAGVAGLAAGMLSKIERGVSSPSLNTLTAVAAALNVPVTAFFRRYEEQRDCAYIRAGEGLVIERAGTRAGHEYRLLGHRSKSRVAVERYLITLTDKSEVFPLFQHAGVEFLFILDGEVLYRHGKKTYLLTAGDVLRQRIDARAGGIDPPARVHDCGVQANPSRGLNAVVQSPCHEFHAGIISSPV